MILSLFTGERTAVAILTRLMLTMEEGRGGRFVTDVNVVTNCPLDPLSTQRLPYTGLRVYVAAAQHDKHIKERLF